MQNRDDDDSDDLGLISCVDLYCEHLLLTIEDNGTELNSNLWCRCLRYSIHSDYHTTYWSRAKNCNTQLHDIMKNYPNK